MQDERDSGSDVEDEGNEQHSGSENGSVGHHSEVLMELYVEKDYSFLNWWFFFFLVITSRVLFPEPRFLCSFSHAEESCPRKVLFREEMCRIISWPAHTTGVFFICILH